jgi:hypothetical protein
MARVGEYKYSSEPLSRKYSSQKYSEVSQFSEARHAESSTQLQQNMFWINYRLIQLLLQPEIFAQKLFVFVANVFQQTLILFIFSVNICVLTVLLEQPTDCVTNYK